MAVSENAGGTQAATVTTEHTLVTITVAGTYQLVVNLTNLAEGATPDIVELKIYVKVRSGSSSAVAFEATYVGGQVDEIIKFSPPVPAPFEWKATLKQTQGTGRNFEWSAYQY